MTYEFLLLPTAQVPPFLLEVGVSDARVNWRGHGTLTSTG